MNPSVRNACTLLRSGVNSFLEVTESTHQEGWGRNEDQQARGRFGTAHNKNNTGASSSTKDRKVTHVTKAREWNSYGRIPSVPVTMGRSQFNEGFGHYVPTWWRLRARHRRMWWYGCQHKDVQHDGWSHGPSFRVPDTYNGDWYVLQTILVFLSTVNSFLLFAVLLMPAVVSPVSRMWTGGVRCQARHVETKETSETQYRWRVRWGQVAIIITEGRDLAWSFIFYVFDVMSSP